MDSGIFSIGALNAGGNAASGVVSATGQAANLQAIRTAASRTGVNFAYLLAKAGQESNLNATAKSSASSATGLFQFTKQTWLQMIKTHGADYGLGAAASQITLDADGKAHVANPQVKQAILALRNDPQISAEMAGELDKENLASLQDNVGGKIGSTDLYLAHFLGAGGASDFINEMRANPNASAAGVLPTAAAANPTVFYDKSGQPRSLAQIYKHFAQKFDRAATPSTLIASAVPANAAPANDATASAASTYTVASAGLPTSPLMSAAKAASTTAAATTAATSTPSSLFATMVLAQAQNHGAALSSLATTTLTHLSDLHKKEAFALSSVG